MFSTKNSREHSLRKRMISNVYSKSYLHASEPSRAQSRIILFDRLLPILRESAAPYLAPHGIDVHSLFLGATMDFIAAYLWGMRNGTNFIQNKGYREHWLELYKARVENGFFIQELPLLTGVCRMFGLRLYPATVEWATKELESWNHELCRATLESEAMADVGRTPPEDEPVVLKAVLSGIDKEEKTRGRDSPIFSTTIRKRDLAVESELFDHVLAGQETAGVALTYAAWRLSQNPDLQRELQRELRSLRPGLEMRGAGPGELPDPKDLDALPLLHAVLMETLRLHAPLPGAQPRQTSSFCQIGGYVVPPGVRVAAMAHTLHRDRTVFPDPERFVPERWLDDEKDREGLRERHRQFWAFSSGGRMCIGSNFAINGRFLISSSYTRVAILRILELMIFMWAMIHRDETGARCDLQQLYYLRRRRLGDGADGWLVSAFTEW